MEVAQTKPADHLDVLKIREQFPILSQKPYGKPLVYLDNAATTQKPIAVINKIVEYYSGYNSNIHRGVHFLSQQASAAFDNVRKQVAQYIHAKDEREIVFTKGTTDGINLVAYCYGSRFIKPGDEVIVSQMEHHSNIVPWQLMCEQRGAVLKVIPINENGELIWEEFIKLLSPKTRLVSVVYISNSLGTINPVKKIIAEAHKFNVPVLLDAAQAMAHMPIDVQDLDCDFLAFSGHKMYGPTGVGCLYGKASWLEEMPPYQGGGDMISSVSFEKTTYNEIPYKFEAGTPHIEGVIALGAALDFLQSLDMNKVKAHEEELVNYAMKQLSSIEGLRLIGTAAQKAGVVSFVLEGINSLDAGMMLDTMGIAVRTGQHCTEPVMLCYKVKGTIRASFAVYNTMAEVDALTDGVKRVIKMLK